jgi:DnaJ-domain-containing protein 1
LEQAGTPLEEVASQDLVGMDVLLQVMQLREEVEQASHEDDTTLRPLLAENQKRIQETSKLLEGAFENKNYDEALRLTARLQYWSRIDETIRAKMNVE